MNNYFPILCAVGKSRLENEKKKEKEKKDQASDSEEVVTPLMLDGTYLSRNLASLEIHSSY